jgi:hypothetical protein
MWETDEDTLDKTEALIGALSKRCPGVEEWILEDLIIGIEVDDPMEEAEKPWVAITSNENGEYNIIGEHNKEDLIDAIFDDDTRDEIIAIFHDGKEVEWEMTLIIED